MQDRIAELARIHGNIDVVMIDPTRPVETTAARWTNAIGLFVSDDAEADDGSKATVLLIIPNPENARTVDAEGNTVPVFG